MFPILQEILLCINGSILSHPLDRPSAVAEQRLTKTCAPVPYNGWTIGLFIAFGIMTLNLNLKVLYIRPATPDYLQCYQLIYAQSPTVDGEFPTYTRSFSLLLPQPLRALGTAQRTLSASGLIGKHKHSKFATLQRPSDSRPPL